MAPAWAPIRLDPIGALARRALREPEATLDPATGPVTRVAVSSTRAPWLATRSAPSRAERRHAASGSRARARRRVKDAGAVNHAENGAAVVPPVATAELMAATKVT